VEGIGFLVRIWVLGAGQEFLANDGEVVERERERERTVD